MPVLKGLCRRRRSQQWRGRLLFRTLASYDLLRLLVATMHVHGRRGHDVLVDQDRGVAVHLTKGVLVGRLRDPDEYRVVLVYDLDGAKGERLEVRIVQQRLDLWVPNIGPVREDRCLVIQAN